jgi:hypothetical protein
MFCSWDSELPSRPCEQSSLSPVMARDERREISPGNPDGVQDADVVEIAALAKGVDCGSRDTEVASHFTDAEEAALGTLDPRWTQRFVEHRCGMGSLGGREHTVTQ